MRRLIAIVLIITTTACVSRRVEIKSLDLQKPIEVTNPVKAHLKDGSTIVFPYGVTVSKGEVLGNGTRYPFGGSGSTAVTNVPLEQVLGMESYRERDNGAQGIIIGLLATAAVLGGLALLAVAAFGSCPTVYSADGEIEEAELFSSSIAPMFEGRDIDRLQTQPDRNGVLSLDIRNEALETHYINHLQLLEVTHSANEMVLPDWHGEPVALGDLRPFETVTSREGRDVSSDVAHRDQKFYATNPVAVDRVTAADMDDWIDVTVPVQPGAESAAVAFRLRNSLLNTVLMYDVMLAPAGAGALNWMADTLSNISNVVEMGRWHQRRSGLHVSVWQDGKYVEVARVPDAGPIAWHDVAAVVPVPAGETKLRLRLSFLVDYWRIDQLQVSTSVREVEARTIPVSEVRGTKGNQEPAALSNLAAPDTKYLQTNPGQRFYVDFPTGPPLAGQRRSFLLSSQGYYTEWIRGSWIQNATTTVPFKPGDDAVLIALKKWSTSRIDFEKRFFNSRVPVK
jgi:hypothetical protein